MFEKYNLNEKPVTLYLYNLKKPVKEGETFAVEETEILMEKWRQQVGDKTLDFYAICDNDTKPIVPPCTVNEVGTIYHGTYMILDRQDKEYYIKKLVEEYEHRAEEAAKSVNTYNEYVRQLKNMKV